jgi:hypothetical protein
MIFRKRFTFWDLWPFKQHVHDFTFQSTSPVNDWRVSQNAHIDTYECSCGFRQTRSSNRNEDGELEERIPALQGECELSMR